MDQDPNKLEAFYLERMTTSLYDASAAASRSVLLFIILYAASGLVLFGPVSGVKFDVVGVELPRIPAGEVLLVLSCAALYQHFTLLFTEVLLRDRLEEQLTKLGGSETDEWFLRYPSSAHFHGIMAPSVHGRTYVIAAVLGELLTLGAFLFPLVALIQIGRITHWSASFAATALLCILLLVSSSMLADQMSAKDSSLIARQRLASRTADTSAVDRVISRWMRVGAGVLLILTGALAEPIGWGIKPGIGVVQISAIVIGVVLLTSPFLGAVLRKLRKR